MRAILQRVISASVAINGEIISAIKRGLLIFVGFNKADTLTDIDYMAKKCIGLRIFDDKNGTMNLSIEDINGEVLIVSQFTLYGDARKGRRPSYYEAAPPEIAEKLFLTFINQFKKYKINFKTGKFRADMQISLINDGPVTIMLDSKKVF